MKLIHRMQLLVALVQELGGVIAAKDLQALLFLYCYKEVEHNHYYEFIPQQTGPYSLQAEADKATLINKKCLEKGDDWVARPGIERFAVPLDFFEKIAIQQLKNMWQGKPGETIHQYIREHYPNFFKDSSTGNNETALENIFYTIGYEGKSPEAYINLLLNNKVKLLCDVRKNAYSQKYGFSKEELRSALEKVGIAYEHIPELGIVSEKRQKLETDKDYHALFKEYIAETLPKQQPALQKLVALLNQNHRIAITCFEANVHHCHRGCVANALEALPEFHYPIKHL